MAQYKHRYPGISGDLCEAERFMRQGEDRLNEGVIGHALQNLELAKKRLEAAIEKTRGLLTSVRPRWYTDTPQK